MNTLSSKELLAQDRAVLALAGFFVFVALLSGLAEPKTFGALAGFALAFFVVRVLIQIYPRKKYLRCAKCKHTIQAYEK